VNCKRAKWSVARQRHVRKVQGRSSAAVLGVALLAVGVSACTASPGAGLDLSKRPSQCAVPAGMAQVDLDRADSAEKPWRRVGGEEVTIYFSTQGLSDRYAHLVKEAGRIWSDSPCLRAEPVASCPADANCVRIKEQSASRDRNTDGEFSGRDRGVYRRSGTITLFTEILDRSTDNGALATIVHEMGHALGLQHRQDSHDVMNATTTDTTNSIPDPIDFINLAVIYGSHS
jgi:hypothetical protein